MSLFAVTRKGNDDLLLIQADHFGVDEDGSVSFVIKEG
jgi:hypothetical protein